MTMCQSVARQLSCNVWVKKTKTNCSSDILLRFVLFFLTQTLVSSIRITLTYNSLLERFLEVKLKKYSNSTKTTKSKARLVRSIFWFIMTTFKMQNYFHNCFPKATKVSHIYQSDVARGACSTPSIPEIIWVKDVRAIVVYGFLMKSLKNISWKFEKNRGCRLGVTC